MAVGGPEGVVSLSHAGLLGSTWAWKSVACAQTLYPDGKPIFRHEMKLQLGTQERAHQAGSRQPSPDNDRGWQATRFQVITEANAALAVHAAGRQLKCCGPAQLGAVLF